MRTIQDVYKRQVQAFGAYLSMIFTFVGMAYQYGHASEVVDSVTVESDIDNFDNL